MSVLFAIPVAKADIKRASITFGKWKDMGYQTMALLDNDETFVAGAGCSITVPQYKGWCHSVNFLCRIAKDEDWIVTGGADIFPDPMERADEIAKECEEYFKGTTGVMQPTGDAYGALVDRTACVSPWIGKGFREQAYGGNGPFWPEYFHFWGDTELATVATMKGVLWWRNDITQYHHHHLRDGRPTPHLEKARIMNSKDHALYLDRKAKGFPGCWR